jgi:hypothetical protein
VSRGKAASAFVDGWIVGDRGLCAASAGRRCHASVLWLLKDGIMCCSFRRKARYR